MNPMQKIVLEKVTLNFGAGKDQTLLEKGVSILSDVSGEKVVKTKTDKRIAAWGLRKGLPIGCKVTVRKDKAAQLLKRLVQAKDGVLMPGSFDSNGNVSFGIPECIDIPGYKYDPKIGILGLQVSVTLGRPGSRIRRRRLNNRSLPLKQRVSKDEAIAFFVENFNIKVDA